MFLFRQQKKKPSSINESLQTKTEKKNQKQMKVEKNINRLHNTLLSKV